jgi:hypothetical protein
VLRYGYLFAISLKIEAINLRYRLGCGVLTVGKKDNVLLLLRCLSGRSSLELRSIVSQGLEAITEL